MRATFARTARVFVTRSDLLLDRNPDPTEAEIREAISGQICRCTGYSTIVRSVRWAAEQPARPNQAPPR